MDLTTELLDNAAFREAKRGGYNTQDVDEFIEQVKAEYEGHEALIREARQRVEAADARLAEAEHRAATTGASTTGASTADGQARPTASTLEMEETLKRTLVLAQRTADAAIKEADEQAARTLSTAQEQATALLADAQEASARARTEAESDARRAHADARSRVLGELRDLEAARDHLHTDVDVLERHLEEQRDRIRFTSHELQRLLDDPSSLREIAIPSVSDVVVPEVADADADADVDVDAVEPPPRTEALAAAWAPPAEVAQPEPEPDAPIVEPSLGDFVTVPAVEEPTESTRESHPPGSEDDAYLAELRKAMTDDSPLGPREDDDVDRSFDTAVEPGRSRFGRRR